MAGRLLEAGAVSAHQRAGATAAGTPPSSSGRPEDSPSSQHRRPEDSPFLPAQGQGSTSPSTGRPQWLQPVQMLESVLLSKHQLSCHKGPASGLCLRRKEGTAGVDTVGVPPRRPVSVRGQQFPSCCESQHSRSCPLLGGCPQAALLQGPATPPLCGAEPTVSDTQGQRAGPLASGGANVHSPPGL